ncbi:MAG: hypothetical protein U1E53_12695 [Dongiaceae bacterium]
MASEGREGAGMPAERAPGAAMALALCFAGGPLLIALELLRPLYAAPLLAAGLAWLWALARFLDQGRSGPEPARFRHRLRLAAGALAWMLPSGIGGIGACHWDYIKHNIVFGRLLAGHLPLALGSGAPFHYYFAYYILPVRLFEGLAVLLPGLPFDLVLFAFYAVVLVLAVALLAWGFRAPAGRLLVLLALTGGGLDLLGVPLFGRHIWSVGRVPGLGLPVPEGLEWWGVPLAPQSFTMHLYWAPQHLFAALIGTALLGAFGRLARPVLPTLLHAGVVVAAAAFWSTYVAIGLAMLVAGELLRRAAAPRAAARSPAIGAAAVAAGAPFCLLLVAFAAAYVTAARAASPPDLVFAGGSLLAWAGTFLLNHGPWIAALALVPAAAAPAAERRALAGQLGFGLAASALLLCFRHGTYNDWAMRTVLPAGLLMTAATARLLAAPLPRRGRGLLLLLLAVSSASSVAQIAQGLFAPWPCAPYGAYGERDLDPLLPQYEGNPGSLLYRALARRP